MGMGEPKMVDDYQNKDHVVSGMPSINEEEILLTDGSTDYRGQIPRRDRSGGWRTGPLILGPETCEKLAVGGIVINLVPYLTGKLHLSSSYSANLITTYQGTSYMFTLLGGFIADALVGRFVVITGASFIQFLGLLLLTLSVTIPSLKPSSCLGDTCPSQTGTPLIIIYISVYLIALGTGGIKSCASPFGADQFDPHHDEEKKSLNGFFSWYFFGITLGAFFAVTVLVYIQDNVGREWGYLIPTVAMLIVVIAFAAGRKLYRYKAPKGSPLTQIAKVFVAAYKKRNLSLPTDVAMLYDLSKKDKPRDYVYVKHSNQFKFLDKAAIMEDAAEPNSMSPWRLGTVSAVEETKMVIRLMPILITTSLFYTVYAQMTTFSVEQGNTMKRKLGSSFEFPAASMAAFLQGAILLTIYLWERAFVPIAKRFTGNVKGVTPLQRIGIGLVISIITMVIAAVIEKERMRHVNSQQSVQGSVGAVNMSIFWLLPQYVLVGSGEALTYAGQLDFFYNESPKAMRSMGAALCVCTLSIGYYTSSLMVSMVNSITGHQRADGSVSGAWLPDNIDGGKLYNFYWMLAAASVINFLLFLVCAHWYKYKAEAGNVEEIDLEESRDSSHECEEVDLGGKNKDGVAHPGIEQLQLLPTSISTNGDYKFHKVMLQEIPTFESGTKVGTRQSKSFDADCKGTPERPHHQRTSSLGSNVRNDYSEQQKLHLHHRRDRSLSQPPQDEGQIPIHTVTTTSIV